MTLKAGDLVSYFERIGFAGDPRPDRDTLAALIAAHTGSIPFENLNPLLGLPVPLDPESLVRKLIHGRRGGYCFEQNGLFRLVLQAIGFEVTGLAARVLWMLPEDSVTPRTHMALLVHLPEGPVLADVGFGGAVCTGVLDFTPDIAQDTPHERYRLVRSDGEWRQQTEIAGEWRTTYRFDLTPQPQIDYELANWWTSTNPLSHFTQGLTIARSPAGRRMTLRNFDFATHRLGEPSERRRLEGPAEVCDVLEAEFGIRIPDREALIRRLEALA
ncbi:MAG: arylamine N-acetyltransferase family protein [Sphingomicrobium sp.]